MSRRLTLVIPTLESGGAERVMARLANYWGGAGDEVTLITLSPTVTDTYALSSRVRRVGLDLLRESCCTVSALWNNWHRVRCLRRALRESNPDVIISFTDRMNVVTLLAARGLGARVIVSERVDPSQHVAGRVWSWLRRRTYPHASAIVVQAEKVREQIRALAGNSSVVVIPNGVAAPGSEVRERAALVKDPTKHHVVAMGRLDPQKGFDLLIEAFSHVAVRFADWHLRILGEGPERARLDRLINEKGLAGRVTLCGWTGQPESALMGSDLFVLSSRYEGFPNALLEAMACGLPAIAFGCESGPAEIIRHEVDGLLVPAESVEQLAAAMERLMGDDSLRARLASTAGEVCKRFGVEQFYDRWEKLLCGKIS